MGVLRLKRWRRRVGWLALLVLVWLFCSGAALGQGLTERLATFPDWSGKPSVQAATGDLIYPDWLAGPWQLTSTLVEMVAPLAPAVITPGFEGNRQFLNQPIEAPIRFVVGRVEKGTFLNRPLKNDFKVISDRAFNGLSLAQAYLGKDEVSAVNVDPNNPNRQITFLKDDRQLLSTVTGRAVEVPDPNTFVTTEVFQQFFRGAGDASIYLNEVENTTAYHRATAENPVITADQITAIYLSPHDPDYFKALGKPVALYRYQLTLRAMAIPPVA